MGGGGLHCCLSCLLRALPFPDRKSVGGGVGGEGGGVSTWAWGRGGT